MERDIHISFGGGQIEVSLTVDEAVRLMEQIKTRICGREAAPEAALAAQAIERSRAQERSR